MTDIDVKTGLPKLPEGYVWVVDHPQEYDGWGFSKDTSKLEVSLRKLKVTTETTGRWPFKKTAEKEVASLFDWGLREVCRGTAPIAVLNAANKVLKRWENQKKINSLMGMYPPKKLDVAVG